MKKTILVLVLIIAGLQLKAQSLNKPADTSLNSKSAGRFFKLKPTTTLTMLTPVLPKKQPTNNVVLLNSQTVYSRMPVSNAVSDDKMPVAKLGQPGVRYTMLVKKYTIVNPDSVKTEVPDLKIAP